MTDHPLDHDRLDRHLAQMTGSQRLADVMRQNLERLKGGVAGPELAEMAAEVLEGRTDLRQIARSSAYSAQLGDAITRFKTWEAGLSPGEREDFERLQAEILGDQQPGDSANGS